MTVCLSKCHPVCNRSLVNGILYGWWSYRRIWQLAGDFGLFVVTGNWIPPCMWQVQLLGQNPMADPCICRCVPLIICFPACTKSAYIENFAWNNNSKWSNFASVIAIWVLIVNFTSNFRTVSMSQFWLNEVFPFVACTYNCIAVIND